MKAIEKTGKTVDLAIQAALDELGLGRDQVQVDVLQIESPGILGVFGRRGARVRVTSLEVLREVDTAPSRREREPSRQSQARESRRSGRQEAQRDRKKETQTPHKPTQAERPTPPPPPPPPPSATETEEEEDLEVAPSDAAPRAAEALTKIAHYFGLSVSVDGDEDARAINLRVGGNDVGQLIGRRGRTLGAVQYVISRIINEDRSAKKKINIDVDGYNENREKSVAEMAARAVDRVLQNGRPYSFRPMSPQDRRLIHVNLQDHPRVATQSVGEEPNRFVVVYPRLMSAPELDRYLADAESYNERRSRMRRNNGGRNGNRDMVRGRPRSRGPAREGREGAARRRRTS